MATCSGLLKHCDLMDQLSDYRACASMSLDDVALAIGLPGKIGGHGSEVEAMVRRGEIDNVRAYCEGDCLNLFVLYVRWALLSGRIDPAGHNRFGAWLSAWKVSEMCAHT
jgi:predicted PolB exonuclease-like 3'-5' exonuclease